MYPDDYKRDFKTISEERIGDCIYAHLQGKKYAYECECCGSSNIKAKGVRTRKDFRDITAGNEAVYLTIEIPRYFCKDCDAKLKAAGVKSGELEENGTPVQSTYSVDCLPACVPDAGKISATIVDEIITLIASKKITVNDAAERMHVAPSSVSEALKKRRKKAEKAMSFQMPDCFVVYPFNYPKNERCALIGIQGNRPMLYAILDDCKEKTIREYLDGDEEGGNKQRKDKQGGKPWELYAVLTDFPREKEHEMLDERYKKAQLGILRECVLDEVAKWRKKSYGRNVLAVIDDAFTSLEGILETHIYDPHQDKYVPTSQLKDGFEEDLPDGFDFETRAKEAFEKMFQKWYNALPKAAQTRLNDFKEQVETNYGKVTTGFTHLELERNPSQLLRFIDICKTRHIPFEELTSWLALVAGVHNRENISAVQMLSSSFVPQPINDFYIDLDELNDLFDKEFRS